MNRKEEEEEEVPGRGNYEIDDEEKEKELFFSESNSSFYPSLVTDSLRAWKEINWGKEVDIHSDSSSDSEKSPLESLLILRGFYLYFF